MACASVQLQKQWIQLKVFNFTCPEWTGNRMDGICNLPYYLMMIMKSCKTLVVKLSMSLKITTTGGGSQCLDKVSWVLHGESVSFFFTLLCICRERSWKEVKIYCLMYFAVKLAPHPHSSTSSTFRQVICPVRDVNRPEEKGLGF